MSKMPNSKLPRKFFLRDVLQVAPELIGKTIAMRDAGRSVRRYRITETEAYRGDGDLACHASKGRTKRTEIMFHDGGVIYVYLIYGMHWMLNVVTEKEGIPQAVLIRGVDGVDGPGRVGKKLELDRSYYGEDLISSDRMWIEDAPGTRFAATPRIGIDYAGEPWVSKPWRFLEAGITVKRYKR